ncbi:MAG: Asp-tRNA(Asn)/Glu-tRNA(Gln) amidotransferase subunit GatB [Deltaproteobacteria bacterium]|nr:Asp-tRNA(Asn)/Glu-tRNA(Gln) amidotransferase subunit GatB [Deltaproteobacteria bacterium]
MNYEPIICFETHVELKTETKLFCDCLVRYDAPPNTHICPVCTGQPGALPVLNKKAVEYAVKAGVALNCTINQKSRFARKNYFYPDLPKGYQISQYERPFCEDGYLEITGDDGRPYAVGIKRIHLEEDAGKLVHSSDSFDEADYSLVDYNRSCIPLIEIVCDHYRNPIRSVLEAKTYLEKLKQVLRYINISDCNMEMGQLRCDVNISLRPKGSDEFGNRVEIKNMASFRFIAEALEYEITRQTELLDQDQTILQETRLFDESKKITLPMRSKEDAPDYRYFPDPDLLDVHIDDFFLQSIKKSLPELPDQKANRMITEYGISQSDALILTRDRPISEFFGECAPLCRDKKRLSHWIIKELFKLLNDTSTSIRECPIQPRDMSDLMNLMSDGAITDTIGRTVLEEMFQDGGSPQDIIHQRGLQPIQDKQELEAIIQQVIDENPDAITQIKAGQTKPVDFLIGQVMKKTRGKADPKKIRNVIQDRFYN